MKRFAPILLVLLLAVVAVGEWTSGSGQWIKRGGTATTATPATPVDLSEVEAAIASLEAAVDAIPSPLFSIDDSNVVLVDNTRSVSLNGEASIGTPVFTGTGLDDLTISGEYNGFQQLTVRIEIDGEGEPDTFRFSVDGGSTWCFSKDPITGSEQPLRAGAGSTGLGYAAMGIRVTFAATTGHALGDHWNFVVTPSPTTLNVNGAYYLDGEIFACRAGYGSVLIGDRMGALGNNTGYINTVVGSGGMRNNTTGYACTAVGYDALSTNTTGFCNTAVGYAAFRHNRVGAQNVAVGAEALQDCTADRNTAVGSGALMLTTAGQDNVAVGSQALEAHLSGSYNTAVGSRSMQAGCTTGRQNTALGAWAGRTTATGISNCLWLGTYAGQHTTSSNTIVIDTLSRSSAAEEMEKALMFGRIGRLDPNDQTLRINAQVRFNDDVNAVSVDHNYAQNYGTTIIDTSGAAMDPNLADGTYIGQTCTFTVKTAGNNFSLNILHHATSDPEVLLLDAAEDNVTLIWDGTDWLVKCGSGYSYP